MDINYGGRQGQGSPHYGADPNRPVPKLLNPYVALPASDGDEAEVFRCPCDTGSHGTKPTCFLFYGTSLYMNSMLVGQNRLGVRQDDLCKGVMQQVNARRNCSGTSGAVDCMYHMGCEQPGWRGPSDWACLQSGGMRL